ncbi:P-loop containing nucleoside triphosphate hydrolase protein [Pelagophyceae sp. CCMP2097]|nr:P-loop containing nucleoside triphosphate hydrolase protein [Pelagophyceae sp. CCMP2097]|mmetsp:Transcript_8317/g.29401  ORF Transcript_8317/g.29401 Transcript_8317/m.29401 type:complete len:289 (-) Transcript_8317:1679-2545(-)
MALPPGFKLLPIAPPVSTLTGLALRPSDIFVCSWPKSGTTWMQAIVAHLLCDEAKWGHVSQVTPFFDVNASWADETPAPGLHAAAGRRAWNTHLLWSLMPKDSSGARYIYVVRNGDDAVVSFYHHWHLNARRQFSTQRTLTATMDDFVRSTVDESGDGPYGSRAKHLADWAAAFGDERVLFVRYEVMQRDLVAVVRAVAAHLRIEGADVDAVAAKCTFQAMKSDQKRYAPVSVQPTPGFSFLRGGRVGDGSTLGGVVRQLLRDDAESKLGGLPQAQKAFFKDVDAAAS